MAINIGQSFNREGFGVGGRGVDVSIFIDKKMLASITDELKSMPDALQEAEYQAVKRTTKSGKTEISKKLREKINLKKKLVDARIKTKYPGKGYNPTGIITLFNTGYPLVMYGGLPKEPISQKGVKLANRKPKGGPSWKVFKDQGRVRGRNHFLQRDRRGKINIMVRTPGGSGGAGATAPKDYRIKYGPGLVTMARQAKIEDKLTLNLTETLEKNLRSQVDRFLERKKSER